MISKFTGGIISEDFLKKFVTIIYGSASPEKRIRFPLHSQMNAIEALFEGLIVLLVSSKAIFRISSIVQIFEVIFISELSVGACSELINSSNNVASLVYGP